MSEDKLCPDDVAELVTVSKSEESEICVDSEVIEPNDSEKSFESCDNKDEDSEKSFASCSPDVENKEHDCTEVILNENIIVNCEETSDDEDDIRPGSCREVATSDEEASSWDEKNDEWVYDEELISHSKDGNSVPKAQISEENLRSCEEDLREIIEIHVHKTDQSKKEDDLLSNVDNKDKVKERFIDKRKKETNVDPSIIPTSGKFYMHDLRTEDEPERVEDKPKSKGSKKDEGRWQHDLYDSHERKIQNKQSINYNTYPNKGNRRRGRKVTNNNQRSYYNDNFYDFYYYYSQDPYYYNYDYYRGLGSSYANQWEDGNEEYHNYPSSHELKNEKNFRSYKHFDESGDRYGSTTKDKNYDKFHQASSFKKYRENQVVGDRNNQSNERRDIIGSHNSSYNNGLNEIKNDANNRNNSRSSTNRSKHNAKSQEEICDSRNEKMNENKTEQINDSQIESRNVRRHEPIHERRNDPRNDRRKEPMNDSRNELIDDSRNEVMNDRRKEPMNDRRNEPMNDRRKEPMNDRRNELIDDRRKEPLNDSRNHPMKGHRKEIMNDRRNEPLDDRRSGPMNDRRNELINDRGNEHRNESWNDRWSGGEHVLDRTNEQFKERRNETVYARLHEPMNGGRIEQMKDRRNEPMLDHRHERMNDSRYETMNDRKRDHLKDRQGYQMSDRRHEASDEQRNGPIPYQRNDQMEGRRNEARYDRRNDQMENHAKVPVDNRRYDRNSHEEMKGRNDSRRYPTIDGRIRYSETLQEMISHKNRPVYVNDRENNWQSNDRQIHVNDCIDQPNRARLNRNFNNNDCRNERNQYSEDDRSIGRPYYRDRQSKHGYVYRDGEEQFRGAKERASDNKPTRPSKYSEVKEYTSIKVIVDSGNIGTRQIKHTDVSDGCPVAEKGKEGRGGRDQCQWDVSHDLADVIEEMPPLTEREMNQIKQKPGKVNYPPPPRFSRVNSDKAGPSGVRGQPSVPKRYSEVRGTDISPQLMEYYAGGGAGPGTMQPMMVSLSPAIHAPQHQPQPPSQPYPHMMPMSPPLPIYFPQYIVPATQSRLNQFSEPFHPKQPQITSSATNTAVTNAASSTVRPVLGRT